MSEGSRGWHMTQCSVCGREGPATARFCDQCGTNLVGACPRCQRATRPEMKFCDGCGLSLSGALPPAVGAPIETLLLPGSHRPEKRPEPSGLRILSWLIGGCLGLLAVFLLVAGVVDITRLGVNPSNRYSVVFGLEVLLAALLVANVLRVRSRVPFLGSSKVGLVVVGWAIFGLQAVMVLRPLVPPPSWTNTAASPSALAPAPSATTYAQSSLGAPSTAAPTTQTPLSATPTSAPSTSTPVPATPTPVPEETLRTAQAALDAQDFAGALAHLKTLPPSELSSARSEDALYRAYMGLAKKELAEGRPTESHVWFERALGIRPSDAAALDGRKQALITRNWSLMEANWSQNRKSAIAAVEEILTRDPDYRGGEAKEKLYALLISEADSVLQSSNDFAANKLAAVKLLRRARELRPDGPEMIQRSRDHNFCVMHLDESGSVTLYSLPTLTTDNVGKPLPHPGSAASKVVATISCLDLEIVGAPPDSSTAPGVIAPYRPRGFWYFVKSLSDPSKEGWTASGYRMKTLNTTAIVPLAPDALPDLVVVSAPVYGEGSRCTRKGETYEQRWAISVRNNGPGTGPSGFFILIKPPDREESRRRYDLTRGMEPGEEIGLEIRDGSEFDVPDRSELVLDPDNQIKEANKANNRLRVGPGPLFTCV